MNAEQQKLVSQRVQRDRDFANIFMGEIMAKRKMRMDAIETSIRVAQNAKETPDTDKMLSDAEKIYQYLIKDGQLSDLAEGASNLRLS